jgi:hypothetical protein
MEEMTNGVFILFGLMMILVILIMMRKPSKTNYHTDDVKIGMNQEQYNECLNWMFQMGIIDSIEYNKMLLAGLPFIKAKRPS